MRNSSSNSGAGIILASILGLIILGLLVYKLRRKKPVVMTAELIDNKGDIEHVQH